ncbi:carboxylating nicotinate-nucleotide diphosphorylase [Aliikangiella maris]|uniref:Carboxylating nicotinate-nucleotide diphosphorylase n=2 Tax=Aliikangiella maris TaxID=3162458 RepID=A0ABV3MPR4_9GAMM
MNAAQFQQLLTHEIKQMCHIALTEDLAGEGNPDITAELISPATTATATLISREAGILCGTAWVEQVFELLGNDVSISWQTATGHRVKDGDPISANQTLCTLKGNARSLLTGERSAMNFLQTLSATATRTAQYLQQISHTQCQLLDTRKTIPGMRFGQKYAVSCGGGTNHRLGLSDAYLIKENHIMACGGIQAALATAINNHPDKLLEIEVENLEELSQALNGKAQVIMLDNFSLSDMQAAIQIRNQHSNQAKLEASGNISLSTIAKIAETGVDFISVGALTKNIEAMDLSMRIILE